MKMKMKIVILMILLGGLAACQSIPKERKNNCACNWEALEQNTSQSTYGELA